MLRITETRVVTPDPRQALNAVRTLRRSLGGVGMADGVRSQAVRALDEIEDELRMPRPDRGVVTARLERLTEVLEGAGAFGSGDPRLIRPIRHIAAWVGPMGAPLAANLV